MRVVDFAREILQMQETIYELRDEVYRLRNIEEQYNKLLNESLAHSQQMVGGMLALCLTPGVTEALAKNAERITPYVYPEL